MRTITTNLLKSTMLALVFGGLSAFPALANSSNTQSLNSNNSQPDLNGEVDRNQAENALQANQDDSRVGIVKSVTGDTLELKLADGTSQRFNLKPDVLSRTKSEPLASLNLRPGTFVTIDTDGNKTVTGIKPASVEKTIGGVITSIDGDVVTLRLPNGATETTIVAPATAARMRLAPGVPLVVTSYRGISATKLCLGRKTTPPIGGGDVPPVKIPPVRAYW